MQHFLIKSEIVIVSLQAAESVLPFATVSLLLFFCVSSFLRRMWGQTDSGCSSLSNVREVEKCVRVSWAALIVNAGWGLGGWWGVSILCLLISSKHRCAWHANWLLRGIRLEVQMSASLNITALHPAHIYTWRRRGAHVSPAPRTMCWLLKRASELAPKLFAVISRHCQNVHLINTSVHSEATVSLTQQSISGFVNSYPHLDHHLLINLLR